LNRRWGLLVTVSAVVLALDIATKAWAARVLQFSPPRPVLGELLRFTFVRNSGVAFGLGAGLPLPYFVLSLVAIAAILYLFARRREQSFIRAFALSLIMGGAIGNLIDRLRFGQVVDFIDIGVGRWRWPVFNVADSAVTVGVLVFALAWPHHGGRRASASTEPTHEPGLDPIGAAPPGGGEAGPLPGERGR
jgi:signal peptidase II